MNQMFLLMIGVLGVAGIGSLLSSSDDDELEPLPDDPIRGRDVIDGSADDEALTGTAADEVIRAWEGDDTVSGGGGNDAIYGGTGDDLVLAQDGDDEVFLGAGNDVYGDLDLGADEGSDTLWGGSGDDTITVNGGTHELWGDDEDDDREGDDLLTANGGQVTIRGGQGDDTMAAFDDTSDAADVLYGGDGDDELTLGAGDSGDGGDGSDRFVMDAGLESAARIADWQGDDRIVVNYVGTTDSPPDVEVVQAGANAQLVVNGQVLAVLQDTDANDVGNIDLVARSSSTGAVIGSVVGGPAGLTGGVVGPSGPTIIG
ncbi:calcium-binding protein [Paracoccus endophyticus]|uniref:calcium-binding protein n=1 Tax=Paracoccus endophyticus TaxID=2233774 RepID=UPI000DDB5333|nr:calcium-binding protein [Paracoccus endophyticus]